MLGATIIILGALRCEGFYMALKTAGIEAAMTSTVDIIEKAGRMVLLGVIDLLLQVNMPISL